MKLWFCSGSRTSSKAAAGSPCVELIPSLSISSLHLRQPLLPTPAKKRNSQQDDGVVHPRLPQRLRQSSRKRSDVRPPMPPDLCLVPHASERNPIEFPPHRLGETSRDTRLARSRRSAEEEDRSLVPRLGGDWKRGEEGEGERGRWESVFGGGGDEGRHVGVAEDDGGGG